MGLKSKAVIFLIISSYMFYNYTFRPRGYRASELLQILVDFTEQLDKIKEKVQDSLEHTALFQHLVEHHAKPRLKNLESLQSQLKKHEESLPNTRVNSDVTEFISFSLDALKEITNQLQVLGKSYRQNIQLNTITLPALSAELQGLVQKTGYFFTEDFLTPLENFGINFRPELESPSIKKKDNLSPLPISALVSVIKTELIPATRKFEENQIKNGVSPIVDRFTKLESNDIKMIQSLVGQLPYIKRHGGDFNAIGEYWDVASEEIRQLIHNTMEMLGSSQEIYEKLTTGIDAEIKQLEKRIKKLSAPQTKTDL